MKSLLPLIVVLLLCVAGLGYYRGWFTTGASTVDSKTNINLTVDQQNIRDDVNHLKK